MSISYVLIISPTPLSGSPVTVETTSAQITVSYNTLYNVTIRAVNCAGMSQESSIVDLSKLGDAVIERDSFQCNSHTTSMHVFLLFNAVVCRPLSAAAGMTITNTPPVTIGGSMLTFTCSGDNEVRTSTCGSSGWSPDPGTFDCGSPVTGTFISLSLCKQHLLVMHHYFSQSPVALRPHRPEAV